MPQTHERSHRKRRRSGFGEQRKNALHLVQSVGIGFLCFGGVGNDCSVTGWVLPSEVTKLLRQGENPADNTLDVLQGVSAESAFTVAAGDLL